MMLIVVPAALNLAMLLLGAAAAAAFIAICYHLFVSPALKLKAEQDSPPPREGFVYEVRLDDQRRNRRVSVGLVDSDIKLRLSGIKEDQLVFKFVKERELEEYEITVSPGAQIFWRPPHARKIEPMKDDETFPSRELIGHPALFRVAASVKNNRPLQYAEFELSTSFFINSIGEEQMRFAISLLRVFPGVDSKSRNKKGLFSFSRFKAGQEDAGEAA